MEKTQMVMTVLGEDRPGLVETLADAVALHGGNWQESRMAHLAGRFAGIVHVEVPADKAAALKDAVALLESAGLTVKVQEEAPKAGSVGDGDGRVAELELVGHDRPGIVRELSRTLSEHGVNVEELHTERTSAAMSGDPIFRAKVKMGLPAGLELDTLQEAVEKIAADLMVDVEFG